MGTSRQTQLLILSAALTACAPVVDVEQTPDADDGKMDFPTGDGGKGCAGRLMNSNMLQNPGFDSGTCSTTGIVAWSINKSPGWVTYAGRPLASDGAGCGTDNFGCSAGWLAQFPHTGAGCLAMWGSSTTPVGESVELRQTIQAPAPIQGLALSYARASDQLDYGWQYELAYEIGGVRTTVESVGQSGAMDIMGTFTMAAMPTPVADSKITVSLTLRRIDTKNGHIWAYFDDVKLDLCW